MYTHPDNPFRGSKNSSSDNNDDDEKEDTILTSRGERKRLKIVRFKNVPYNKVRLCQYIENIVNEFPARVENLHVDDVARVNLDTFCYWKLETCVMKSGHKFCSRKRVFLKDIFSDLSSPTMDVAARYHGTTKSTQEGLTDRLSSGTPSKMSMDSTSASQRSLPIMLHEHNFRIIMGVNKLMRAKVFGKTSVPCIFVTCDELERFKMTFM